MKVIAETAWHHEGDVEFMKDLAKSIKESKADIAKFHITLDLDEYIDKSHSLYNGYQTWKISKEDWRDILNIFQPNELMLLCNDTASVEFAMEYNPYMIELHAVCMNDLHLLDSVKKHISKDTKIALGISGNTLEEIDFTINYLNHPNIVLMYGFQNYPTDFNEINFNRLKKIMQFYPNYEFGYADHCGFNEEFNELVTIIGASLGVNYIEKHLTTQFAQKRLDYEATISFDMLDKLCDKLKIVSQSFGSGSLEFSNGEKNYSKLGTLKKAPMLNQDVKKGEKLTKDKIVFKRAKTDYNYSAYEITKKIGSSFNKDLTNGSIISPLDFSKE